MSRKDNHSNMNKGLLSFATRESASSFRRMVWAPSILLGNYERLQIVQIANISVINYKIQRMLLSQTTTIEQMASKETRHQESNKNRVTAESAETV
jgi:hypothetical protein